MRVHTDGFLFLKCRTFPQHQVSNGITTHHGIKKITNLRVLPDEWSLKLRQAKFSGINLFNHDKGVSKRYHKLVIVVAFFFAVSCCSFLVNTAFDKSEPVTVKAEIIRTWAARSGGNHRFLVSSDERPYGASLKSLIVNVSEQAFEDFEKGDTVSVSVRKGALGINYCRFVEDGYTDESIWNVQFE